MPQVDTWDYENRRIFLSFDTVINGVNLAEAYLEERAYRAVSGEDVRGQRPMMKGQGRVAKGGGVFTPQFVLFLDGARPVPYDTSHVLRLLTEPISDDGTLSGSSIFDRSPLSPTVEVDIDIGYQQVEIITVSTSGETGASSATLENQQAIIAVLGTMQTALNEINAHISNIFTSISELLNEVTSIFLSLSSISSMTTAIQKLIRADEKVRRSTWQKLEEGTDTVLLEKNITSTEDGNYDITQ